jgi:hypothetical protein
MPEEAEQPRDLFTFLRKEYEQQEGTKPTGAYTALVRFTEFSSEYLAKNQPIATYYDEGGLGLQLQEGQRFALSSSIKTIMPDSTSIPITTPGRTWMPQANEMPTAEDTSVPITGTPDDE